MKTFLISLADFLDKVGTTTCSDTLSKFTCSLDPEIEAFLSKKSLPFLERSLCSTFLLLNLNLLSMGELHIEAFFTLSFKAIPKTEDVSKNKVKQITGFKDSEVLPFVLIGQIGKFYSEETGVTSDVSLSKILDDALSVIRFSNRYIPNKWILVECSDIIKEKGIYEKEGFTYFKYDGSHHQYIRTIGSKSKT